MEESKEEKQSKVDDNSHNQLESANINSVAIKHENPNIGSSRFNALNLFDEKQLAAAENFLTKVMRSDKGGFKSINEGLAVLMRAQDLQLPFSTCLEHIHVINGKTGIDIHIVKALLSKAGVTWECLNDYTPLYEYTDGFNVYIDNKIPDYAVKCKSSKEALDKANEDKSNEFIYIYPVRWYQDFNGNLYKDYQLNASKFAIVANKVQAAEVIKANKVPVYRVENKPIDYITKYKFTRVIKNRVVTSIGHFSYSEAVQAEMFEKDTYKKYPRILIGHRAFTLGARDIASDILMGAMETTELKIVSGKELSDSDFIDVEEI